MSTKEKGSVEVLYYEIQSTEKGNTDNYDALSIAGRTQSRGMQGYGGRLVESDSGR